MIKKSLFILWVVLFVSFSLTISTFLLAANWSPLPDTGQTICYDNLSNEIPCPTKGESLYGQDAQYQSSIPSYTTQVIGEDIIVFDNNTNLVWQWYTADINYDGSVTVSDKAEGQGAAWSYCQNLTFAGLTGWRLPTIMELESIVDYSRDDPALNTVFQAHWGEYWSSTPTQSNPYYFWVIGFYDYGRASTLNLTYSAYTRCVLGTQQNTTYSNNGDTISDNNTGLTWQKQTADANSDGVITQVEYPTGDLVAWQEALDWCENSTVAGFSDWRLPNIRELNSLVDRTREGPAIDPVLFQSKSFFYWSSTTVANSFWNWAWGVDFSKGNNIENMAKLKSAAYARCVRGGMPPPLLTQTQVSQLYVSIFGRASEGDGNAYWQSEQSDMTVAANTMLNTEPAKAYFGDTLNDNQMFIEFIYKNTLGKDYADDPAGVNYWVSELTGGKSKGQVVATLINAAIDPQYAGLAAQDQFLNKVFVSNYTAETISKCPDVNDLSAFVNFISGVTDDPATVVDAKAAVDAF